MRILSGVGLVSALVLLFQVTLTRLFSIAQFYHFAFLVVSLALLGFGASGSLLAVWPRLRARDSRPIFALAFAPATVLAYVIVNQWAFDSYAIAWDRAQMWQLLGNLLALAVPFTLAGALIGNALSDPDRRVGHVYGANMIGSALGAAAAPLLLAALGDARLILLCSALSGFAAVLLAPRAPRRVLTVAALLVVLLSVLGLAAPPDLLAIQPSPYKALSHFRRNPDATMSAPRYNAYARLDTVRSPTIHSAPGLSMTFFGELPPEIGLLVDGDNLLVVPQASAITASFARAMPAALALEQFTAPDVLVLGLGGGLDAHIALALGAQSVTGVEPNSLVIDELQGDLGAWAALADDSRVTMVHQELRTYTRQTERTFDIVQLALNDAYRPVNSGAFTLTENYVYTVEGFASYLDRLRPGGVFIVTRWLQQPPSEDLRTLGLIAAALERRGGNPATQIVAYRTFQTVTFLVKKEPFAPEDIARLIAGAEQRAYDMVLPSGVPPSTVNQFARIETPVYYTTYTQLVSTTNRERFYADYAFEVSPPTDNRPFFFHFFKWRQTPDVLDNLGRTWQPFGGSGFFVLVALLTFATLAALLLIVLPVGVRPRFRVAVGSLHPAQRARFIVYFGSLGLAYLLIEVATIQQFVLLLGQPTLAIATVLATLLLFSGIGSTLSERLPWNGTLAALVLLLVGWPVLLPVFADGILPLPLAARLSLSVGLLAPLGLLMGVPFARGLAAIRALPDLTPWAWAINGSASVTSAVIAAMVALSFGFNWVMWVGSALYALAWFTRPAHA